MERAQRRGNLSFSTNTGCLVCDVFTRWEFCLARRGIHRGRPIMEYSPQPELPIFRPFDEYALGLTFAPDGKSLAITNGLSGEVQFRDVRDGHLLRDIPNPETNFGVKFSPDGRYFVTGDSSGIVRLWDTTTGKEVRQFIHPASMDIYDVAFSPDGKTIVSASMDKTARLWDAETGKEIRQFSRHTDAVWSVIFSPDGKTIATASADGTARLWDVQTGEELRRFVGHTAAVENAIFSPDGKFIVTAGDDGLVRLWDVDYHATIQYLCSRLLRDFTDEERAQYNIMDNMPTCPKH